MKAPSTNIFNKIGKGIWKGICAFFNSPISVIVLLLLLGFGFFAFVKHLADVRYPEGDYELVYKVYYTPNNIKQYTIRHNRPIEVGSSKGTNYIHKYNEGNVIQTSAPIEVVRYVNYKKKDE